MYSSENLFQQGRQRLGPRPTKKGIIWEKCPHGCTIELDTTRLRTSRRAKGYILIFQTRCEQFSPSISQRQILKMLDCLADDAERPQCTNEDCSCLRWKYSKYCVAHLFLARQRKTVRKDTNFSHKIQEL